MRKSVQKRRFYEPRTAITRLPFSSWTAAGDTLKTLNIRDIALIKEKALYYFRNENFTFKTEPDLNLAECYTRATLEYLQKHNNVDTAITIKTESPYGGSDME